MTTRYGGDEELDIEGYSSDQVDYHLDQLAQADFVHGRGSKPMRGNSFCGMTWEGHDFLDCVRDPDMWKKTKDGALQAGGWTFDLPKSLAKGLAKKKIENLTGVKL